MHRLLPVASYQKVRSYSDYIDQDDQQKKDVPRKNSIQPEIIGKRVQIIFLQQIL